MRAGFIPTAPLSPSIAFTFDVLDLYYTLNKHHRRIGLQPFMRALREFHGLSKPSVSVFSLSKAYDCFLAIRRFVSNKINWALGRTEGQARLLRACPACFYKLAREPSIKYSFLCAVDGNMSLKRFKNSGTVSNERLESSYFIPRDEVEKFANVVQVRKSTGKKNTKKSNADLEKNNLADGDVQDAQVEMAIPVVTTKAGISKDGGDFPLNHDPFNGTFEEIVSECAERWKANSDDQKKTMWDCFDECGVFIMLCRHGHILAACDIVKSGEQ
jgi:hypothetical protein